MSGVCSYFLWAKHRAINDMCEPSQPNMRSPHVYVFFPKQELLGSSPQKNEERAWRDGWHVAPELGACGFGAGGPRSLDGWHAVASPRTLDGWHAAQELGARGFGWVARGSRAGGPRTLDGWHAALGVRGVWMGGAQGPRSLDGWHGFGAGGPRSLDGWHAVWMGGTRLWGSAEFGFGAGGPRSLDGWHAALGLGAHGVWSWGHAEFGWVARGSGAGGPRFGWLARGGGLRSLDGWHAALELGAGGPRNLDGWHVANALGFSAQSWRFEPTYTVDKHFEQAQTYTNTHTHVHACSEPNWFCKMWRKMNMMSHSKWEMIMMPTRAYFRSKAGFACVF